MAAEIAFPIALIHRKTWAGVVLTEPLSFPEFLRLGSNRSLSSESARRAVSEFLAGLRPQDLLGRRGVPHSTAGNAVLREFAFTLTLAPPRASEAWREEAILHFHAVVWEQPPNPARTPGAELVLARIPELGITVIANKNDDLTEVLRRETLATLRRLNLSTGLKPLAGVQNTTRFQIEWVDLKVRIRTLKERALHSELDSSQSKKSILKKVATAFEPESLEPAFEIEEVVSQIVDALSAKPPQSVLLIGPSGVGKSAAVRELARRRAEFHMRATPFFQTSGARLVAGQTGFGMWEERCQELIKEASKLRAVLHVGPLVELMEVGKSEHNVTGIATFLRPAIARGDLLCIAECTPEQIPLIEKQSPQLLDAFRHVVVDEPGVAEGKAILKWFADSFHCSPRLIPPQKTPGRSRRILRRRKEVAARGRIARLLQPAALEAIDRLHRRYATYSANPGRPLRFLENLIRDGVTGTPITEAEVYARFTRETGLPPALVDPAVPLDVATLRDWFSTRVVGQAGAVDLVVDLIATVKAGLTRPNRPIASLLFIGPTGVGKTEMAKALAEFLFGSRERLTRFDMSEYADPISVRRLVGGAFGSEGLLTAKVREQPFSVILLDEVEKGDPSVFDLLLQALGEARLTDAGGRLADFRNTVVILTSNLGAESYRKGASGFAADSPARGEAQEHFRGAVEKFLRPEMFNRLDRIVSFDPLGAEMIRRIADREWSKVLGRDGVRFRGLSVATSPELLDHLAAIGFDPRYGARPLKRAMERELLAPFARQLNRHGGEVPLSASIALEASGPAVSVRPVQGARPKSFRQPNDPVGKLAVAAQVLRRWHQLAQTSSIVRELENDVYQLREAEKRILKKQLKQKTLTPAEQEVLAKLGRLREIAEEVERQRLKASALEDEGTTAFYEGLETPPEDLAAQLAEANLAWDRLLLKLYALSGGPQTVLLALFSEDRVRLGEFAMAYAEIARREKMRVAVWGYAIPGSEADPGLPPEPIVPEPRPRQRASDPDNEEPKEPATRWSCERLYLVESNPPRELLRWFSIPSEASLGALRPGTIGLGLELQGPGAHVQFWSEEGLHEFVVSQTEGNLNPNVLVYTSAEGSLFRPPEAIVRRGAIKAERTRRTYDLDRGVVTDHNMETTWTNLWGSLADRMKPAIDANTRARLTRLILE